MKEDNQYNEVPVRPYCIKDLIGFYKCTRRTLYNWLAPHHEAIGPRIGRYWTMRQVQTIFAVLGAPPPLPKGKS